MRISDVKVFVISDFVYVKIVTDEGLYGIGEASLSCRTLAVVEALGHIKPLLIGKDATRIEFIWQDIFRGTCWRGGPVLQSALAGIDIALWDLAGKALGVPTYRLLGGAARDKVLVYCHLGCSSLEEMVDVAQQRVAEGWKALRICPSDTIDGAFDPKKALFRNINYFAALRKAIGEEVEVILEAHFRQTPARAIELCNSVEEFRPFFVEDPIRSENPGSFATVRSHTSVPLGTGEQLTSKWGFRELIERELIDYIRVDICHAGGITEGKKIAVMGEVHYQELACHYTGSPVCTAAMMHLNMSIPNCAAQEHSPCGGWWSEAVPYDWRMEDGYLVPSGAPGLGVDINEEAAGRHPYGGPSEPPHWRRHDGSVQDW